MTDKRAETHACDCISRQAAIDAFDCTNELIVGGEANARNVVNYINKVVGKIKDLPSAQPAEANIQKMQDLEQAEIQKAYELGKLDAMDEIVKCKDCKHKHIENSVWVCPFGLPGGPEFFCGYGSERREE